MRMPIIPVVLSFGAIAVLGARAARTEADCDPDNPGMCCTTYQGDCTTSIVEGTAYLAGYNPEINKCKYRATFKRTCQLCDGNSDPCVDCGEDVTEFVARCGHYYPEPGMSCPVGDQIAALSICSEPTSEEPE
jgi:hypothetical protein